MASNSDATGYLAAILDAVASVEDYVAGLERDAFERDEVTRDAVERCIARVCTAVSRLDECAPALLPDQPWGDAASVGDLLHHAYRPISADIVWTTVGRDLPKLKLFAALMLDRLKTP